MFSCQVVSPMGMSNKMDLHPAALGMNQDHPQKDCGSYRSPPLWPSHQGLCSQPAHLHRASHLSPAVCHPSGILWLLHALWLQPCCDELASRAHKSFLQCHVVPAVWTWAGPWAPDPPLRPDCLHLRPGRAGGLLASGDAGGTVRQDRFWPLFLSVVVVPASLQLLLLHCFPESPRYLLIERNDICGATKDLTAHHSPDGSALLSHLVVPQDFHGAQHCALHRFLGTPDVQDVIKEMKEEQQLLSSMEMVSVWQLLRDRSVRWQTLSVVVVNAGMQLSGIDAIWFYTNTIFENTGIPVSQIPYTTVGTGAIEIIAGLIGCFTIERVGRRPLIITGFCAMGVCSAGITVSLLLQATLPWMRYVSVACVVGIITGFCMGPAGVPFLMTAELFMQSHRPAAYIVGGSLNWLCNFTVGFIFPFLQMSAGAFCYLVFCGVCLLVALYVYLVIPETKNKTFMEISHIFATRRSVLSIPAHLIGMMKLNGYGTLESSSLEGSGSSLP
ncbi:PREDICTED: solute carrier family 2, facilitated glucose transporter member 9-like isoform X5 [Corvus brachyrhynchos]|uniref:solute carrier family 2, facilitated glucose transporter member 9-like isoform X5 n=1 Tax=Corvus brachyrhynchos TaxID=85066 RepID=UPI0008163CCC|nr:PREDICTED: solute carrier family 2, facilitated glucose transporter member 9-like isoform X5 [Corvus brachyrhynchos]